MILDEMFKKPDLRITKERPIVFLADWHIGGGGKADNFNCNVEIGLKLLTHYDANGYMIVVCGDLWEGWQFTWKETLKAHPQLWGYIKRLQNLTRLIWLGGNHDNGLRLMESLVIDDKEGQILCTHGHKGDLLNDQWWKVGRWFTRYVWKPLELVGVTDPTSASKSLKKHVLVRSQYTTWANENKVHLVYGHLHDRYHDGYALNVGCGTEPGEIHVVDEMNLKVWK